MLICTDDTPAKLSEAVPANWIVLLMLGRKYIPFVAVSVPVGGVPSTVTLTLAIELVCPT